MRNLKAVKTDLSLTGTLPQVDHKLVVEGISVDPSNTKRIDQIFSYNPETGVLLFAVPVNNPFDIETIAAQLPVSLSKNTLVTGLVCEVNLNVSELNPIFYPAYLNNTDTVSLGDFQNKHLNNPNSRYYQLAQKLIEFHKERVESFSPFLNSPEFSKQKKRVDNPENDTLGREDRISPEKFISHLSVFMHHMAGKFLRDHNCFGIFRSRTLKVISDEESIKISSYRELARYLSELASNSIIQLNLGNRYFSTTAKFDAIEGDGINSGYALPWTDPLRSNVARVNSRIICALALGKTPEDIETSVTEICDLKNAEVLMELQEQPRTLKSRTFRWEVSVGENAEEVKFKQLPDIDADHLDITDIDSYRFYQENLDRLSLSTRKQLPSSAQIAFASYADRTRKDWRDIRQNALAGIKAKPESLNKIASLLHIKIEDFSERVRERKTLEAILKRFDCTLEEFETFPFSTRGISLKTISESFCTQSQNYYGLLEGICKLFGFDMPVVSSEVLNSAHIVNAKFQIKSNPKAIKKQSIEVSATGSTFKSARARCAALIIKNLLDKGQISLELLTFIIENRNQKFVDKNFVNSEHPNFYTQINIGILHFLEIFCLKNNFLIRTFRIKKTGKSKSFLVCEFTAKEVNIIAVEPIKASGNKSRVKEAKILLYRSMLNELLKRQILRDDNSSKKSIHLPVNHKFYHTKTRRWYCTVPNISEPIMFWGSQRDIERAKEVKVSFNSKYMLYQAVPIIPKSKKRNF